MQTISIKEINRLAIPAIISGISEPLIALADTAMIGRLGTTPLGATGLGASFFLLVIWILTQTKTALSAIVSKHYGAKSLSKIKTLIPQALVLNISIGFVTLIVLGYFAKEILQLYAAKGEILSQAVAYFKIRSLGFPVVLATYSFFGVFRGLQNTVWAMKISLLGGLINIILDYLLIYGIGPFDAMGIRGAAYASFISQIVMMFIALIYYLRKTQFDLKLSSNLNKEIFSLTFMSIGLFIRTIALNVAFFLGNRFATSYGDEYIAAHTIALNIWLFSSYFIDGYSNAGNALAGRLSGEKAYKSLHLVAFRLLKISIGIGAGLGLIYLLSYNQIPLVFSKDPEVIRIFKTIFWLVIISQPINAIAFCFDGIFKGLGKTTYLMTTLLLATIVGFIPTLLIGDYNDQMLHSVWYAFIVFMIIRGLSLLWKFQADYKIQNRLN